MKTALSLLITGLLVLESYAGYGPELHKGRYTPSRLQDDKGFRLPKTAKPNRYDLTLTFGLGGPYLFAAGNVVINLNVDKNNDKNVLYLNSNVTFAPNAMATWTKPNGSTFNCAITPYHSTYISLNCTGNIIGTNQTVSIRYTPYISVDDLEGAYVARFNEYNKQKYIVTTQFEQIGARRVFPSFDEPEYKAPIGLTLIIDDASGYATNAIANTVVKNVENSNGFNIITFEDTPSMSTYLLAFIITQDFSVTNIKEQSNNSLSIFARKSADDFLSTAKDYTQKLIDEMGDITNITYSSLGNDKMTLAAIPEFAAGAMENWGLLTFRENYLIDEGPNKTSVKNIQKIVQVIAHELTHQWFGDSVTMAWWSDTWLNEGFATFFEYYLTEKVLSDFEMIAQLIVKEQQDALKADAYPDTIPLSNNASNVTSEDDFSKEFGTISYSKGASIIKMIKETMGHENFFKGLSNYLKDYKNKNAESADLIKALQEANTNPNVNFTKALTSWIFESGYPIVNVALDTKTNNVTFTAARFFTSLNESGKSNENIWNIPLSYTTNEQINFTVSLKWVENLKEEVVEIPKNGWIIVNLKAIGFYRVNYDENLWNRLTEALIYNYTNINVINRAQLLDDAFNIAKASGESEENQKNNYMRAFALAQYLKNETEYHPWYTFFVEIQYLLDRIQDNDTLDKLKDNVIDIMMLQVDNAIKSTETNNSKHIDVLKTNLLLTWSCKLGYQKCIHWAVNKFKDYKRELGIDNNYRDVILCTGLANSASASADYNFLLKKLDKSILPGEQNDLANALTCTKSSGLTFKLFKETLMSNHSFSRMLYPTLLTGLISDDTNKLIVTLRTALLYDLDVNDKWKAIGSIESILATIAAKSYSKEVINIIQNDYLAIHANDSARTSIVKAAWKAINTIETNTKWVDKYGDILTSVIVYGGDDIPTSTLSTKTTVKPTTGSIKPTTGSINPTTGSIESTTSAAGVMSQNVFLLAILVVSVLKVFYC